MNRQEKFESLAQHPYLSKKFNKLPKKYLEMCRVWLLDKNGIDSDNYAKELAKLLMSHDFKNLSSSEQRNLLICDELLCSCTDLINLK